MQALHVSCPVFVKFSSDIFGYRCCMTVNLSNLSLTAAIATQEALNWGDDFRWILGSGSYLFGAGMRSLKHLTFRRSIHIEDSDFLLIECCKSSIMIGPNVTAVDCWKGRLRNDGRKCSGCVKFQPNVACFWLSCSQAVVGVSMKIHHTPNFLRGISTDRQALRIWESRCMIQSIQRL